MVQVSFALGITLLVAFACGCVKGAPENDIDPESWDNGLATVEEVKP
jgi:hypothetical protein